MAELKWRIHRYKTLPNDFYLSEGGDWSMHVFHTNRDAFGTEISLMDENYKEVSCDETYEYMKLANEAFCASEDDMNELWVQYA